MAGRLVQEHRPWFFSLVRKSEGNPLMDIHHVLGVLFNRERGGKRII
jgi:hypothetical protein